MFGWLTCECDDDDVDADSDDCRPTDGEFVSEDDASEPFPPPDTAEL